MPKIRLAGKFQMCFHEKAVQSRWCLSPVLKCSVGTLGALCIHCVRCPSGSVLFSWKALWICQRHPIYVISQHLFLTKWHCGVNTSAPKNGICLFWTWKPCVRHHHITKNNWKLFYYPLYYNYFIFPCFFRFI